MPNMSAVAVEERKEGMFWRVLRHPKNIRNKGQFLEAVELEGMIVGVDDVINTILHPLYSATDKELDDAVTLVRFVVRPIADQAKLGPGPTADEVCTYALDELGLKKCPLWVAPILRLNYLDQPADECLIVVTEDLILPSSDVREMFHVIHYDGTLRLTTCPFPKDRILPPGTTLVFVTKMLIGVSWGELERVG